jgi:hypothetical protein
MSRMREYGHEIAYDLCLLVHRLVILTKGHQHPGELASKSSYNYCHLLTAPAWYNLQNLFTTSVLLFDLN